MIDMTGKYVLHQTSFNNYAVLRAQHKDSIEYEDVIPDAGINHEFAIGLVALLNSQGSQVGHT